MAAALSSTEHTITEPVIHVSGLSKTYGTKLVVDKANLTVNQGEIVGFLGPNGSGKTTTIRMICGLLTPDSGQGRVLGYDVLKDSVKIRAEVGYMTQRFSFYEDLTIEENLAFVARLYQLRPMLDAVNATLTRLGLDKRRGQLAGALSGGWKQRLALAACIMHHPKLLLLDEPTAGVDPKARRDFWDEIHALARAGMTVLVSTHYMDEAERCNRISYIANGVMLTTGTVKEVIAKAKLVTIFVDGENLAPLTKALRQCPEVLQVEAFGMRLHIVGHSLEALQQAITQCVNALPPIPDFAMRVGETSLEDVFIEFMTKASG